MKTTRPICYTLAWLAIGAICLPAQVVAAESTLQCPQLDAPAVSPIGDVALGPGGLLTGRVWDQELVPQAEVDVAIKADGRTIATTRTDANGVFAVNGLRGGVHQVVTPDTSQVLRLWADGTSPPSAARSAEIVCGADVVRGQWGGKTPYFHKAAMMATNPFLVGGIIATAVAVPVIIHNTNDDDPPHS